MSRERICELAELAADGLIGEAQLMELEALLADDPEAERAMAELLVFETELRGLHRPDLAADVVLAIEAERRDRVTAGVMDRITGSDSRRWQKTGSGRLQAPKLPGTSTQRRQQGSGSRRRTGRHQRRHAPVSPALERKPGTASGRHRSRSATTRRRRPAAPVSLLPLALAAGLLLVLGIGFVVANRRQGVPAPPQEAPAPSGQDLVAVPEREVPKPEAPPEPAVPTVTLEADAPLILREAGGATRALAAGSISVPVGATLHAAGTTRLRYADGSCLLLRPGSDLRFDDHAGGPRLDLTAGSVAAQVAKQSGGCDFRLSADGLEVRVLGTRFTVTTGGAGPAVALEEGAVACRAHGREVVLAPWQRAHSDGSRLRVSGDELELYLVDALEDRVLWELGPLEDGRILDLGALGLAAINFVVLAPADYTYLHLNRTLDGEPVRASAGANERFPPFTVFGDDTEGDYYAQEGLRGRLVIEASPPDGVARPLERSWSLTLR